MKFADQKLCDVLSLPRRALRSSRLRSVSMIIGGSGVAIALLVLVSSVFLIKEARQNAVNQWRVSLVRFTRVLAGHADQSFRSADLILNAVREDLADTRFDTAEGLRLLDTQRLSATLKLRVIASEQIHSIAVHDMSGSVLVDSVGLQTTPSNPLARSDLGESLAATRDMPFISEAVMNPFTGKWQVFLTRPLFNSNKVVIGAVSVLLRDEFFTEFYRKLNFTGVVRMTRGDGVILTQYPQGIEAGGRSVRESDAFQRLNTLGPDAWEVSDNRIFDGAFATRIIAAKGVENFPLVVFASAIDGVYLARWYVMVKIILVGATAVCALVLGFTYVVVRLLGAQRQLSTELEVAMRSAERSSLAKSDFVAMMSHEVRNPLNVVYGMAELLRMSRLTPEQRRYVESIQLTSKGLVSLMGDAMAMSRLQVGRAEIQRTPVPIQALLARMAEQGQILAKGKPLRIRSEMHGGLPPAVLGDPERMQQVLLNLIGNAIKFTPSGSVTIRALPVSGAGGARMLRLEVEDTGPGISEAERDRLFEPYVQGKQERKLRDTGAGLGLAICRSVATLLGGEIGLDPRPGPGALFYFQIPIPDLSTAKFSRHALDDGAGDPRVQANAVSAAVDPAKVGPLAPAMRILVAEDDPMNRSIVELLLQRLGHTAVLVENGALAVDAVTSSEPFDLALLDIQMPVMDGLAAARRIRSVEGLRGRVRLVAMTAQVGEQEIARAARAGFSATLSKPFAAPDLQALLQERRAQPSNAGSPG